MCIRYNRKKFIKYVGLYGLILLLLLLKYIRCMDSELQTYSDTNSDEDDDELENVVSHGSDDEHHALSTISEESEEDIAELELDPQKGSEDQQEHPAPRNGFSYRFCQRLSNIKGRLLRALGALVEGIFTVFCGTFSILHVTMFRRRSMFSIVMGPFQAISFFFLSFFLSFITAAYQLFIDEKKIEAKRILNLEDKAAKIIKSIKRRVINKGLYKILGISPEDSFQILFGQYEELCLRFHPDMNPSSEAENLYYLLNYAYDTLANTDSRIYYDRYGLLEEDVIHILKMYKYVEDEEGPNIVRKDGTEEEEEDQSEESDESEESEHEQQEPEQEHEKLNFYMAYILKHVHLVEHKFFSLYKKTNSETFIGDLCGGYPLNLYFSAHIISGRRNEPFTKMYKRLENEGSILAAEKLRRQLRDCSLDNSDNPSIMSVEDIEWAAASFYSKFMLRMVANIYYYEAYSFLSGCSFKKWLNDVYYNTKIMAAFIYGYTMVHYNLNPVLLTPHADPIFSAMLKLMKPRLKEIIFIALNDESVSNEECKRRARFLKKCAKNILNKLNELEA